MRSNKAKYFFQAWGGQPTGPLMFRRGVCHLGPFGYS